MRSLVVKILISTHSLCSLPGPKLASWIYVKAHINQFKGCIIDALIFYLYIILGHALVWFDWVWFGLVRLKMLKLLYLGLIWVKMPKHLNL